MTKDELKKIIENDPYHKDRINPSASNVRLYLREVNYHCPLCGKELQSRRQKKPEQQRFQIALTGCKEVCLSNYVKNTMKRILF